MRFCLTLCLQEKTFPIEYRKVILSYVKNALCKCNNGKYYESFFKDTKQKDYCFSVILPKPKFSKEEIILNENNIKIIFSTNNKSNIGFILFSAFIAQKNKVYPLPNKNFMTLKSIHNVKQEQICNSKVIFKTTLGSGLCVREHNKETNKDKYYVFNDKDFNEKLKIVLKNQMIKSGFTEKDVNEVKINPINCKKIVIKHYQRYIDSTIGYFEIQASSDVLQYFYDVGIGSRKSIGFGMLDLITQDLL